MTRTIPALVLLLGCAPMDPSGAPFRPVLDAPVGAAPAPVAPQGDFDFEAEARAETDAPEPTVPAEVGQIPVPAPVAPAAPVPVWDPTRPLPQAWFGVRVVAVLAEVQPPRAVLGLSDGREVVVTPGTMLADERLVVLAIGRDAVQVAHVTPDGFSAKVEVDTVRALFPSAPAP